MQPTLPPQSPALPSTGKQARRQRNLARRSPPALPVRTGELRRVLVAVDFSLYSERTVAAVGQLPLAADAEVHLVHVMEMKERQPDALIELELLARRELEQRAAALQQTLRHAGLVALQVRARMTRGAPVECLTEEAQRVDAELIVAGRHGRRRFGGSWVGSTAEHLVRRSRCPVLIVQRRKSSPWQRPLVAIDLEQGSPSPLPRLRKLCPQATRVDLLHVYDTSSGLVLHELGVSPERLQEYDDVVRQGAQAELERALAATALKHGVEFKPHLRQGDPCEVILSETRACHADLLVLGTHARRGVVHLLMGSVAESVLKQAPCDVLIIPPER